MYHSTLLGKDINGPPPHVRKWRRTENAYGGIDDNSTRSGALDSTAPNVDVYVNFA